MLPGVYKHWTNFTLNEPFNAFCPEADTNYSCYFGSLRTSIKTLA